jgi:exonuclease SbcC
VFTLTRLEVEGFRGFQEAEIFEFNQCAATLLFGDNGSGKSSTLNAIEWVLFGDDCAGKQTGIRERVGWPIANRHLSTPAVQVRLEMEGPGGTYKVVRMWRQRPRRAAMEECLELKIPDGTTLTGDAAQEKLANLLKSSFRDFSTTVYLHQEVIRAVLTQEPRDRNDAIDRLLGLSDQRNFLTALDSADLRGRQKDLARDLTAFEDQIKVALAARENDLAERRQQAQGAGLAPHQLNGKAALGAATKTAAALKAFAEESQLDSPVLPVPDEWTGLAEFETLTKNAISQMRGKVPGIDEQSRLLHKRRSLLAVKTGLENLHSRCVDLSTKARVLDEEHGSRAMVLRNIGETTSKLDAAQEKLRRTNGRAAVVNEAISFLDSLEGEQASCPVCETTVPGLADKLKELWEAQLKSVAERITVEIDGFKSELKRLRDVAAQYEKLHQEALHFQEEQAVLRSEAAKTLAIEFSDNDDPLALVGAELRKLEKRLEELGRAIQDRQGRLDAIEQELNVVHLIGDYLLLEQKKQVLDAIQESNAFKELQSICDQVAQLVQDVDEIKNTVTKAARDEAEKKLTSAGEIIDQYFHRLSEHPAVDHLKLTIATDKRTGRNSYDITDQDGDDLTPLLNQGDLNALALAIFLGLAVTAKETSAFGFLILDDPSQSLDVEHKKRLVELLVQVAPHKRLLLATMDGELQECLTENFTKSKIEYRFGKWTPEGGPTITTHDLAGGDTTGAFPRTPKSRLQPARR